MTTNKTMIHLGEIPDTATTQDALKLMASMPTPHQQFIGAGSGSFDIDIIEEVDCTYRGSTFVLKWLGGKNNRKLFGFRTYGHRSPYSFIDTGLKLHSTPIAAWLELVKAVQEQQS